MIAQPVVEKILSQYTLPVHGLHGVAHWARVLDIGARLSESTGANLAVVELFAVFHDSRRENEHNDPQHGRRGAELAASLRGSLVRLSDDEFEQFYYACSHHTEGKIDSDPTIATCWDSDRLDLPRAQIIPVPEHLSTHAARDIEMRAWAEQRAVRRVMPDWVEQVWGIQAR